MNEMKEVEQKLAERQRVIEEFVRMFKEGWEVREVIGCLISALYEAQREFVKKDDYARVSGILTILEDALLRILMWEKIFGGG